MPLKCLFIAPSQRGALFPRGVACIAGFLKKNNIDVEVLIVPYDLGDEDPSQCMQGINALLEDTIRELTPDFVGVSNTFTHDYPLCQAILASCKMVNPEIKTAIGGQHVTFLDSEVLKESKAIDFVIRGEGEWTLLELLGAISRGDTTYSGIEGLSFRKGERIVRTPNRKLGDLSELPPIDFNLFPEEFVRRAWISNLLVRGCSFRCAFCPDHNFWRQKVRVHPIDDVLNEIEVLSDRYGKTAWRIEDNMLNMRCKYFYDFCDAFRRRHKKLNLGHRFTIYTRIDTITDHGLQALKRSGINGLSIGIESGSEEVLKVMNKGVSIQQIVPHLEKIKKYGFSVDTHWVIGHPGDNPKEARKTLDLLRYLYDKELIQFSTIWKFLPFPGSRIFQQRKEYEVEILSFDWSKWGQSEGFLCQLKDFSVEEIHEFYCKAIAIKRAYETIDAYRQDKSAFHV